MKQLSGIIIALIISLPAQTQQNLVFDNTYNSGNTHIDLFPFAPHEGFITDYGGMKQLNDSVFIYFTNYDNWQSSDLQLDVYAKTVHSDGTVSVHPINDAINYSGSVPDYWPITDVVTGSGGSFFVLRNAYNPSINKRYIEVQAYIYDGNFAENTNWGSNGNLEVTAPSANIYGAKGTMLGNNLALAYNHGSTYPINVASSIISGTGVYAVQVVTSNASAMASNVADVIAISTTEMYIADNASTFNSGDGTYDDAARLLKWRPANGELDITFGGGDGIALFSWNWDNSTPFQQDLIKRIVYDGGKIVVAGSTRMYDGSPNQIDRGIVTRLSADGTTDITFGNNGVFSGNFSNDYFRWWYNDIDITTDNKYIISAGGITLNGGSPGVTQSFILPLALNGGLQTGLGNNGFLYENTAFTEIEETIIIPGSSALENQFIFNGTVISGFNPDTYTETALGRLVWSNSSNPAGVSELEGNSLRICPNPAGNVLNVESNEAMSVQIVNTFGELVTVQQLKSGNNIMHVSNFPSGLYFIQTENGSTTKFIKQ